MGLFRRSDRIASAREERRLNAGADQYIASLTREIEQDLHTDEFLLAGPVANSRQLIGGEIWWVTNQRIGVQRGAHSTTWYGRSDVDQLQVDLRNGVAVIEGAFADGQSAQASFMEQGDKMAAYVSKFIPQQP